ncbi:uncharacterized protein LOC133852683 [Alnus glutinosa]|uniref:uncharacterized protein LOC133852683 n=1 Tax=Alnus glutinosa TaxID=3517 RepID=UPI002D776B95|nr:uncharacterized protein LOC133852683 [Alnus glutinosa]
MFCEPKFQPAPWLCVGDFNEIAEQSEKVGATLRREPQMVIRNTLEFCGLSDLGYKGPRFTWCNNRSDDSFTKERLNRALANVDWCFHYQQVMVQVLAAQSTDHHPILFVFQDINDKSTPYRRGFKFEAGWLKDPEFLELIRDE